jgi:hypothetical protein
MSQEDISAYKALKEAITRRRLPQNAAADERHKKEADVLKRRLSLL